MSLGNAAGVAGGAQFGIFNIQNVYGGNGGNALTGDGFGNILIGGAGDDVIDGGIGPSLLIGDTGADSVTGDSQDDILIGDTTTFDKSSTANRAALEKIFAEWTSADSYDVRFHDIDTGTGGGLNGTFKLNFGTTVNDDHTVDDLYEFVGITATTWFFQGTGDTLENVESGEHLNNNTPAAFMDRAVTSPIDQGSIATVSGTITEPDPHDRFLLTIDWGDGTPIEKRTFPPGSGGRGVSETHRYHDDGSYAIKLIWTDPTGPANHASLPITVNNAPPTVDAGGDATRKPGKPFERQGSFTDPGKDTWTATVDYGDGSGPQTLVLDNHHFHLSHRYTAPGAYRVVVSVLDDDGAVGIGSFTISVA